MCNLHHSRFLMCVGPVLIVMIKRHLGSLGDDEVFVWLDAMMPGMIVMYTLFEKRNKMRVMKVPI